MAIDQQTKIKIAHWYYELGYTQEQIGKRLQIPRQRINRIVKQLVGEGIVTIQIHGLERGFVRMESELEERFQLRQAIVADGDGEGMQPLHALGGKAGAFLDGFLKNGMSIGISWGFTVGEAVHSMRGAQHASSHVIQLVGSMNAQHNRVKPDEITRMLASKLGCGYQNLYAPATFSSRAAKDSIAQEESVMSVLSAMQKCDTAIMGIGELGENATIVQNGYITDAQHEGLRAEGYVGDICFNHFDINGRFEDGEFSQLTLGIGHETLRSIPNVIAIAGGEHKCDAIMGALRTGCIDILITDSRAARSLIGIRQPDYAREMAF